MAAAGLAGLRVADFTWAWAGPYLTMLLAEMGAEVIKIESNTRIDVHRRVAPYPGGKPGINRAAGHVASNRGKLSLTLDLKTPGGLELVKQVIAVSDIVAENFSAGAMARLGLGYEEVKSVHPNIIYIALSGYGATGPYRSHVSLGAQLMLAGGLTSLTGDPKSFPSSIMIPYPDPVGGTTGALAVLSALEARRRTGQGCYIDLSQLEALVALMPEALMDYMVNGNPQQRSGNHDPAMAPHNVYPCQGEEQWVTIAVETDEEWSALVTALGEPAWAKDARYGDGFGRWQHQEEIDKHIADWTSQRAKEEVSALLQQHGIAATPVFNVPDLFGNEHLKQRGFLKTIPHPEEGMVLTPGVSWGFHKTPGSVERTAPLLGEHNSYVLRDILGLSEHEIQAYSAAGALQ